MAEETDAIDWNGVCITMQAGGVAMLHDCQGTVSIARKLGLVCVTGVQVTEWRAGLDEGRWRSYAT